MLKSYKTHIRVSMIREEKPQLTVNKSFILLKTRKKGDIPTEIKPQRMMLKGRVLYQGLP